MEITSLPKLPRQLDEIVTFEYLKDCNLSNPNRELAVLLPMSFLQHTTEVLLTMLPENWGLWRDSGAWRISDMDNPDTVFDHPACYEVTPRPVLIAFLVSYQLAGGEVDEGAWWALQRASFTDTRPYSTTTFLQ